MDLVARTIVAKGRPRAPARAPLMQERSDGQGPWGAITPLSCTDRFAIRGGGSARTAKQSAPAKQSASLLFVGSNE